MMETIENWALHAFADGELEGEEKVAIERLLASDDAARQSLNAIRQQKSELHRLYDAVLDEPVPARLLQAVQKGAGIPWRRLSLVAASVALLGLGGLLGFNVAQQFDVFDDQSLARRASLAHETFIAEVRHPVEVNASDSPHLQAWLSKRIGDKVNIPDLTPHGYALLGGRLLAEEGGPAGQLMYEDASKQRLTIFVSADAGGTEQALRLENIGKTITCYWRDGKLALAVTGDVPKDTMMALAKSIYDQMDQKG